MRKLSLLFVVVAGMFFLSAKSSQAQFAVGIGVGSYGPPACQYGYYGYAPYGCAPYGYYGPEWFNGGLFIGAGPWFRGGYGYGGFRGVYGRGYGNGGYGYARGGYGGFVGARAGYGGYAQRGFAGGGGFRGGSGGGFHGGGGGRR